jgi:membrane associated rhomboid family serine protease
MPIGDDDTGRLSFPVVTILLIAVNVLVFLLQLGQGPHLEQFVMKWSVVPLEYSRHADLPPEIPYPYWATLFSSMFMHGGLMHLFGNMLYLWIFGDNVEDAMGKAKYLVFYLICGVAAAYAQILVDPQSQVPSLGASGAISGVLGAYLVLYPSRRVRVWTLRGIAEMPAVFVIGIWILFQFLNGLGQIAQTEQTGGVAYAAHVGGFVAGLLLVWLFRSRSRANR